MAGESGWIGLAGADDWRMAAMVDYGFWAQIFDLQLETGTLFTREFVRLLTFPLIHSHFYSALFTVVLLLCLGKFAASILNSWAFLTIFFLSSLAGAVAYGLLPDVEMPLLGGYSGVFGLCGSFSAVLGIKLGWSNDYARKLSILPILLLGIHIAMRLVLGGHDYWVAYSVSMIAGFCIAATIIPSGWKSIVTQLISVLRRS